MKLFSVLKKLLLEYIHPNAEVIYSTTMNEIGFEFYDSPHIYEKRKQTGTVRLKDMGTLIQMIKMSVPKIYHKYYLSGKKFKEIESDDPKKIRFALRRTVGSKQPTAIIQIEEFLEDKGFVFVVITYFDEEGENLNALFNKMRTRFILDV